MSGSAVITITSGPDRGRVFELAGDPVQIGHGAGNQVELSDDELQTHQASIAPKNGRFAIFPAIADVIDVNGKTIPGRTWTPLPDNARIRMSERTSVQFQVLEAPAADTGNETVVDSGNGDAPAWFKAGQKGEAKTEAQPKTKKSRAIPTPPALKPAPAPESQSKQKRRKSRKGAGEEPRERRVAKFVTDAGGKAMVSLGDDGHLPELQLQDGPVKKARKERVSNEGSPVLYIALGMSMLVSLALLIVPSDNKGASQSTVAEARREIVDFYGEDSNNLKDWQRWLRDARLARSRGDRKEEVIAYRKVLRRLNQEEFTKPGPSHVALTGDRELDQKLRKLIATLLQ